MTKKRGIPLGALWGFLVVLAYIYAYTGLGLYFVWQTPMPHTFFEWGRLIFSSFGYLMVGIFCLIPTLLISAYFIIRDRNLLETISNHWPVFATIVYMIVGPFPGPIDDAVVGVICGGLEIYGVVNRKMIA